MRQEREKDGRSQPRTINILSAENERNRIGRDLHDTVGAHSCHDELSKPKVGSLKQMDKEQYDAAKEESGRI
ncbi:MAG: hypothetical protein ACLS9T_08015 [Streptococcus salivarius]